MNDTYKMCEYIYSLPQVKDNMTKSDRGTFPYHIVIKRYRGTFLYHHL